MADAVISGEPNPSKRAAPSVVAVVVTRDPGPWFGTVLRSLVDQDYRNLSILVLDAASTVDPTPQVADIAPDAFVRRFEKNPGFGAIANEVQDMVDGAAFYLFCHDDVALDPGAVRLLVEEMFRSNAGVAGPKLVEWDDSKQLLHAGMGSDKFGVPAPIVEPGELDQEQHDSVRDVFAVSSAALLIRADLFDAIGGFDTAIDFFDEDSDLCWRAHIAGARVLAVPAARGRHVASLDERPGWEDRDERRLRLQARHRLRNVLTNYGRFYLVAILIQHVALSIIELLLAIARGRAARVRAISGAYVWNLRQIPSILSKRKKVRGSRQLSDVEIRRLQVRGSSRFNNFVRRSIGDSDGTAETGRGLVDSVRSGISQEAAVTVALVALVLLAGSRHLITRGIPGVGEFAAFGSPRSHLGEFWSGWSRSGLGTLAPDPSILGLTGLLGYIVFGAMGFLRTWLILGLLPIGLLGAWRLGDVESSSRGKLAAMLTYAAMPVAYNSLAGGHWSSLAAYAAAPWIVRRLIVVAQQPAELDGSFGPLRQALGLGLIVGGAAFLHPGLLLAPPVVAVTIAIGSLLAMEFKRLAHLIGVACVASAIGALLHLPWMLGLNDGRAWTRFLRPARAEPLSTGDVIRMATGSVGGTVLVYGLVAACLLGLAVGQRQRLTTAIRGWALVIVSWLVVFAADRDWLTMTMPADDVLFAFGATGLALAASAGIAAFETDVRGRRFGWRQIVSLIALLLVCVSPLTTIGAAFGGRWGLPRGGFDRTFVFAAEEAEELGPMRSLWLGDAEILPMASQPLEMGGLSFALIDEGVPRLVDQWAAPADRLDRLIPDAVDLAASGETNRLGRLLAPFGVRYLVVAHRSAPAPYTAVERPVDESTIAAFASQLDLTRIQVSPGSVDVFRNQAWRPLRGSAAVENVPDHQSDAIPEAFAAVGLPDFEPVLGVESTRGNASGPVAAGTDVVVLDRSMDRWEFTVDGEVVERRRALGWANQWSIEESGLGELALDEPGGRRWLVLAQLVAWPAVAASLFVEGRRRGRHRRDGTTSASAGLLEDTVHESEDELETGAPETSEIPDEVEFSTQETETASEDTKLVAEDVEPVDQENEPADLAPADQVVLPEAIDLREEVVDVTDSAVAQEELVDQERALGLETYDADTDTDTDTVLDEDDLVESDLGDADSASSIGEGPATGAVDDDAVEDPDDVADSAQTDADGRVDDDVVLPEDDSS